MTQHHEKIVCYSLGLRSAPKLEFTGQESRSFFAVQYHAWVLHVGAMMLIVIITFCNRQLELRGAHAKKSRPRVNSAEQLTLIHMEYPASDPNDSRANVNDSAQD
ncbi:hypothetical protein GRJ2_001309300 [Grus japonensis]|uniref:Uncharacterized protein n=1 Tax=Grus japonensis TaxID=30415 RepID=A0ABC9WSM0_GRUJA